MQLKVMTFNVRGTRDAATDGVNAWDQRRNLNIATIRKAAPDIIGFQEAMQGNLDFYESLSDYAMYRGLTAPRRNNTHEHTPLYWLKDRFQKLDEGSFYLSQTPEVESIGWEAGLVRVAAWVKLHEAASGHDFIILNTHFPHEADIHESRAHCAKLIVEQVATLADDLPMIIMGDFNAIPDSPAYRTFIDAGFVDSYATTGQADAPNTFHGFAGQTHDMTGVHIDWIMTTGFKTMRCEIITDAEPPLYPSDHYPVMAALGL